MCVVRNNVCAKIVSSDRHQSILFLISRLLMARKLEVDHQTSSEGPQVSYSSGTVHGKPPVLWFFRDNNPHCVFSSGPFHNTVWSKERTLLNIQNNIEHTLRPMYSPLVSSVTHFCNNDTYEQKNKTLFIKGGWVKYNGTYVCM